MTTNRHRRVGDTQPNRSLRREGKSGPAGIAALALIGVASCGANGEPEAVVGVQRRLLSDDSGYITISIKQCPPVSFPNGGVGTVSCPVDDGFVLVGGGGRVVGEPVPGALLQASKPNGQSWFVQARDHVHPSAYQLQAASIGLMLQNIPYDSLRYLVDVETFNSGTPSHAPRTYNYEAMVPDGTGLTRPSPWIVLGGGASVHNLGGKQFLTESVPLLEYSIYASGWGCSSKDHEISYLDTVDCYIIRMQQCPYGAGTCLWSKTGAPTDFVSAAQGTGYRPASTTARGAITAIGAATYYNGAGRMLTAIWPGETGLANQSSLMVDSKDHDIPDSSVTFGGAVTLFSNDDESGN
jgi:hypothetical protein